MRTLLGILFGIVAAMVIVEGVDRVAFALYPIPLAPEAADPATLAKIVVTMPLAVKLLLALGWLLGSAGGAWLALRVCDQRLAMFFVVGTVIGIALASVLTLPHPLWMKAGAVTLPIIGGALATRGHRRPYSGEALLG